MYVVVEIKQWHEKDADFRIIGLIPTWRETIEVADKVKGELKHTACLGKILIIQANSMESVKAWITTRNLPLKEDGILYYIQKPLSPPS